MKKTFAIYVIMMALFLTSCARSYYKEPVSYKQLSPEKNESIRNVNNIFN